MQSNYKPYDHVASFSRIDEVLAQPSSQFEEVNQIPKREDLTFTNGYYANCSAVFVDIRDSSSLPTKYKRPRLAKIYRAYIAEVVAIMNGDLDAREINIVGDGVWGVFNTPYKSDIEDVLTVIARINGMIPVLNYKMKKKGYETPIKVGIGAAYGRALIIKAGAKGSTINDVVYMGDVVNRAAKCAAHGNSTYGVGPVVLDEDFACNLTEEEQGWFARNWSRNWRVGSVSMTEIDEWYQNNCP